MRITIAILLFLTTAFLVLQNHLFVAAIVVLLYSSKFNTLPLILLAILIDGYFGNFYHLPLLSLIAIWWHLTASYIRPKLSDSVQLGL